jgi:hypothetical protein
MCACTYYLLIVSYRIDPNNEMKLPLSLLSFDIQLAATLLVLESPARRRANKSSCSLLVPEPVHDDVADFFSWLA